MSNEQCAIIFGAYIIQGYTIGSEIHFAHLFYSRRNAEFISADHPLNPPPQAGDLVSLTAEKRGHFTPWCNIISLFLFPIDHESNSESRIVHGALK